MGDRGVRIWLWTVFGSVFAMVAVGGITRLTGSGLSMVEWHPLMGTLPPLDEQAWHEAFVRYQRSPQYQQVNHWMELADFKRIFFWEYLHRLLGRVLGLVFALPWLVFVARGRLRGRALRLTAIALVLGGAQGVLGWIMVESGLVDRPSVSHFRLAAHLSLALFVSQWILWILLDMMPAPTSRAPRRLRRGIALTVVLLVVQIVYGAFMAGTHAGLVSATFPDMNGYYGPTHFVSGVGALVHDPLAIHWMHRTLAWVVLLAFLALAWSARRQAREIRVAAFTALAIASVQLALGAATVIFHVPIAIAVAHQCVAVVLLSATVWLAYRAGVLPRRDLSAAISARVSASSST